MRHGANVAVEGRGPHNPPITPSQGSLSSIATSRYRPPPRPQDRRIPAYRRDDVRPTLLQFVLLSMCLHALVILLFGAPSGGSREGRAMWGSLEVELRDSYRDAPPSLRFDRAIDAQPREPTPARPAAPRVAPAARVTPPVRLNASKELAVPKAAPTPVAPPPPGVAPPPAPAFAAPPPPVITPAAPPPVAAPTHEAAPPAEIVVPPMMQRAAPPPKLDRMETFTVPPPTQVQATPPPPPDVKPAPIEIRTLPTLPRIEAQPLPSMAAPVELKPAAPPVEMKPLAPLAPIESQRLPAMAAPAELRPVPPPVEVKPLAPMKPLESPALPALAPVERMRIETPDVPVVPTTPPVQPPALEAPALPTPRVETARPPVEAPLGKPAEERTMEAPAVPAVPAKEVVPAAPAVPAAAAPPLPPALREAAPALPREPAPAATSNELPGTRSAPPSEPPSVFRAGPEAGGAPRDYDPTRPRDQGIDLDAMRRRAGELAREGSGNRAVLAFPLPPVPKDKTKLEKAIEKGWKPDCKTAYSSLGLAAVVPLIANEFGDGNCRW